MDYKGKTKSGDTLEIKNGEIVLGVLDENAFGVENVNLLKHLDKEFGRETAIPGHFGGSDHRLGHPADGFPEHEWDAPAGYVRPGRGAGRRQRSGDPDSPANGFA